VDDDDDDDFDADGADDPWLCRNGEQQTVSFTLERSPTHMVPFKPKLEYFIVGGLAFIPLSQQVTVRPRPAEAGEAQAPFWVVALGGVVITVDRKIINFERVLPSPRSPL
jgi:hypothetical protein